MTFETESLTILQEAIAVLGQGFDHLPALETPVDVDALRRVTLDVAARMQDNYPYQHPLYAGQMLKPPHPIARIVYALCLWMNPNNHALDGGRASSHLEKEAVAQIAAMFGWDNHLGHLCAGGTIANLEALWVARQIQRPGQKVAVSSQAHYTHKRMGDLLKLDVVEVASDARGKMDVDALERLLDQDDIGTVIVTLGTTLMGAVDPLDRILDLQARYGFRIHVDAAYGGYFTLAGNLDADARQAFDAIGQADSIAIDPHKHGLQPYGCGCIVFRDPSVGRYYKHDSPYTYFTSDELHLGEISLECSRPGASAVALWATQQLLPMTRGGEFAHGLEQGRQAALSVYASLNSDPRFFTPLRPELDIVIWLPRAAKASTISELSRQIFAEAAERDLHLALANIDARRFPEIAAQIEVDQETITVLRSCLMKPEHLTWTEDILTRLDTATTVVINRVAE